MQQANHPKRGRTFWYYSPRGFANEYEVGIANNEIYAKAYKDHGFERIDRERAIRELTYRGDEATQAYVTVTVNGDTQSKYARFELARIVRQGGLI